MFIIKKNRTQMHTEQRPGEDTGGRQAREADLRRN